MKLSAVIGAGYGDEGKGHVTDYLAGAGDLVVLFNGGAQRAHTVVTPGGCQHIFHHFGSGTFKGADTFLSRYFIVNPIVFQEEYETLGKPKVLADPLCLVTTPWDMMLNHAVEAKRGDARHGSCGLGINETVERNKAGYRLLLGDLEDYDKVRAKLDLIEECWLPKRTAELGVDMPLQAHNTAIFDRFVEDCEYVAACYRPQRVVPRWYDHVIFEGGQGLGLDEKGNDFPYVTRSGTGLTNVVKLMFDAGLDSQLHVFYVTRPYLTRHGAGPLLNELEGPPYPDIEDATNQFNQHQGDLRYAWLDVDALIENILKDLPVADSMSISSSLAITCLDQMPTRFNVVIKGRVYRTGIDELIATVQRRTSLRGELLLSYPKAKKEVA